MPTDPPSAAPMTAFSVTSGLTTRRYAGREALAFRRPDAHLQKPGEKDKKVRSAASRLGIARGARFGIHLRRGVDTVIAAVGNPEGWGGLYAAGLHDLFRAPASHH